MTLPVFNWKCELRFDRESFTTQKKACIWTNSNRLHDIHSNAVLYSFPLVIKLDFAPFWIRATRRQMQNCGAMSEVNNVTYFTLFRKSVTLQIPLDEEGWLMYCGQFHATGNCLSTLLEVWSNFSPSVVPAHSY